MPKYSLKLGREVEDKITGYKGIVTSSTKFLTGCDRFEVQSRIDKDGMIPVSESFDAEQLKVIGKGVELHPEDPGGPRNISSKKTGATRR